MSPAETDYAYLAGLIDGEGTFAIMGRGTLRMTIAMTTEDLLRSLCELHQGAVRLRTANNGTTQRPCYEWTVSGKILGALMVRVSPYLRYRSKDAVFIIRYYDPSFTYHDPRKAIIRNEFREYLQTRPGSRGGKYATQY